MSRTPLLETTVVHPADAEAAEAGGADRLALLAPLTGSGSDEAYSNGRSPEPSLVSAVVRSTSLPVRPLLRLSDGYSTTGGELGRLVGLAESYLAVGADGVALGFLTADLEVDVQVVTEIVDQLPDLSWTFDRAIDKTLEPGRSWRLLRDLPGLDHVLTAGSALGVEQGQDSLVAMARADARTAILIMAGGRLRPEHIPWLARAGVRAFHVGAGVRPGGSWTKAYVDAGFVRAWRLLLDDEVSAAEGVS